MFINRVTGVGIRSIVSWDLVARDPVTVLLSVTLLTDLMTFLSQFLANVKKYSVTKNVDDASISVKLVRVHQKNLRQLLRHILLVRSHSQHFVLFILFFIFKIT
jgi:hypothetical protein